MANYGTLVDSGFKMTDDGSIKYEIREWGEGTSRRLISWKGPHTHGMCFFRGTQIAANKIDPLWTLWTRDDQWSCRGESLEKVLEEVEDNCVNSGVGNLLTGMYFCDDDDAYIEASLYVSELIKEHKIDQFWL